MTVSRFTEKVNGYGAILRFITPLMVGLLLALQHQSYQTQESLREEVKELRTIISNHVMTEIAKIGERLSRVEERLNIGGR